MLKVREARRLVRGGIRGGTGIGRPVRPCKRPVRARGRGAPGTLRAGGRAAAGVGPAARPARPVGDGGGPRRDCRVSRRGSQERAGSPRRAGAGAVPAIAGARPAGAQRRSPASARGARPPHRVPGRRTLRQRGPGGSHDRLWAGKGAEPAVRPQVALEGKERPVGWRRLPKVVLQGLVPLDACLRPETNVTAYATVAVKSDKAERVAVRVGSSGAIKVWVNGKLAIDHDVYRPVRLDQDAGAALLQPGWNRVTLKVSAGESGGFGFFARLTRPDGGPLPGLTTSVDPESLRAAAAARRAWAARSRIWARSWAPGPERTRGSAGLDRLGHLPTLRRARGSGEAPRRRGAPAGRCPQAVGRSSVGPAGPGAARPERPAHALETGRRAGREEQGPAGGGAALHRARGGLRPVARGSDAPRRCGGRRRRRNPDFYPAQLKLAELSAESGAAGARGRPARRRGSGQKSPALKVLRAQATLATRQGHKAEAEARLHAWARPSATTSIRCASCSASSVRAGSSQAALQLLDRHRAGPARPAHRRRSTAPSCSMARGAATRRTARSRPRCRPRPRRREAPRARRAAAAPLGKEAQALERLRRRSSCGRKTRSCAPTWPSSRRARPKDATGPEVDLQARYAEDVPGVVERSRKTPKDATGAPCAGLLDSGGHPRALERPVGELPAARGRDPRRARRAGRGLASTSATRPTRSRWRCARRGSTSRTARFSRPSSTDEQRPVRALVRPVLRRARRRWSRFAALEPGDVDRRRVRGRRRRAAQPVRRLLRRAALLAGGAAARSQSRYVLIAPKSATALLQPAAAAGLAAHASEVRGRRAHLHFARRRRAEDRQPSRACRGFTELAAYVHVSTYKTWDDVGDLVLGPGARAARADAADQARGARGGQGAQGRARQDPRHLRPRRQAARAMWALEFGIHGYQPYRVPQVFARKFGDCKDKACLLVVMLREVGVDASLVLARTRHGGDSTPSRRRWRRSITPSPTCPSTTCSSTGPPSSPAPTSCRRRIRTSRCCSVNDGQARAHAGAAAPSATGSPPTWRVTLDAERRGARRRAAPHRRRGRARVAPALPVARRAPRAIRARRGTPSTPARKSSSSRCRLDDLERPVEVQRRARRAATGRGRRARVRRRRWSCRRSGARPTCCAVLRAAVERKHDLVLGYPVAAGGARHRHPAGGFQPRRLPEPRTAEAPFGRFSLTVEAKGREVSVTATLEVKRHRISKEDYPAFRRFCAEVDAAVAQDLTLGRSGPKEAAR